MIISVFSIISFISGHGLFVHAQPLASVSDEFALFFMNQTICTGKLFKGVHSVHGYSVVGGRCEILHTFSRINANMVKT